MKVGDLLEWCAGAAAITATYLGSGRLWAAFGAGAVIVFYEAQCYGAQSFPWPKVQRPGWLRLLGWFRRKP